MASIRLSVPETASKDEVIEVKALIQHPMESGFRRGSRGEVIEQNIIVRFDCMYNDRLVFASDFHPSVSANPFLSFHTIARESGTLVFTWTDQHGESWSESTQIEIV